MAWTDPSGRVRWSNAAFDFLAGRPHARVLGADIIELLPLRSRSNGDLPENPASAVLRGRTLMTGLYRLRDTILEFRGSWVASADEPVAVFALREPSEADQQFRLLVDAVKDYAIVMLDPTGRVVSWNSGAERIKGYKAEEIVGKSISCFYPPEDIRAGGPEVALREAERTGRIERDGVWRLRKDGSRFLANVVVTAIRSETGRLQGFSVVTRDITESSLKSQELARSNAELERFASAASHDLLEPLRKISAFGDLLDRHAGPVLDEKGRDFLGRMRQAAVRMSKLVEDLLRYSRVFGDSRPFESVDLNAVAATVLSDLETRAAEVQAEVCVGELPTLHAHRFQMHQLLQNLLSNALKFRSPDRRPRVEMTSRLGKPGFVELVVADNGIGFDQKDGERIFEPFVRLNTRTEYEGTGLGLSLCRRIAMRHGGWITAAGKPGSGSVFTVTLPIGGAP